VSEDAVALAHVIPDELDGPLQLAFHLPGDPDAIACRGCAVEQIVGAGEDERAERSVVSFIDLDELGRARIANYVNERLGLFR
jgi:hypothetical protein